MTASEYIQLIAMGTMFVAVLLLFVERMKSGRGLGARTIQLTSVFLIVPMIFVLALEKVLSSETTATLIGALIGYVLSGIGDFRPDGKEGKKEKDLEPK